MSRILKWIQSTEGRLIGIGLFTALISWRDFRSMLSKSETWIATFCSVFLIVSILYVSLWMRSRLSENFLKAFDSKDDGLLYTRASVLSGIVILLVFTLVLWDIARRTGLLR